MNDDNKIAISEAHKALQLETRISELEHALSQALAEKEKLSDSESKLRRRLEDIPDLIFEVDDEGRIVYFSPSGQTAMGYDREDLIGRSFMGLVHPDDQALVSERFVELCAGVELPLRYRIQNKSGDFSWVRTRTKPRMENGVFIGAIGTLIDLTEQKKLEDALRESEEKYRQIFENSREGILIARGATIRFANPALENILGQSISAITTRPFVSFIHPDDRNLVLDRHVRRIRGEDIETGYHFRIITADGQERWVAINSSIISWNGEPASLSFVTDITESRQVQDALRESEELYRTYVENSMAGVFVVQDGLFIFLNEKAASYAGYRPDELIGKKADSLVHPDDRKTVALRAKNMLSAGDPSPHEFRIVTKGGQIRWIMETVTSIQYKGSKALLGNSMDVTDSRRAEEALRESRELEESILKSVPHALFGVEQRRIIFANDAMRRVFGWRPEDLLGKSTRILFRSDDEWQAYGAMLYGRIANEPVVAFESDIPFVRSDGTEIHCRNSVARIGENLNEENRIVATFEDISERRRMEKQLLESQRRLSEIIDFLPDATLAIDQEKKVIVWNKAIEKMTGVKAQDMIGRGNHEYAIPFYGERRAQLMDLVWAADQDLIEKYPHIVREGDSLIAEAYCGALYDGRGAHVFAKASPLYDPQGRVIGAIESIRDISGYKQAEHALRESEGKLAALFAAMTELVVLHDLVFDDQGKPVNYRISDCNKAFTDITGIKREAAVGRLATEIYQMQAAPYLDEYSRVAITGEPYRFETYYAPMDRHFWISVVSPGRNKFATISADITANKIMQELIATKNRELEQMVYIASHDLRAPLVNVDGYGREMEYEAEELVRSFERQHPSIDALKASVQSPLQEMRKALRYIRNSTSQMDALLKGLLKMSRAGRAALTIRLLDMDELIARVAAATEFQIRKNGVDLRITAMPPCLGDAVQVTQVFSNLLGNALKYLDPKRPGVIRISGSATKERSLYCVEDNGIGIAPEHQERIFELFHRLESTGSEGEGLGLTIVRQIIVRLGGDIRVESTPGKGSRFYVALPAAPL